jgi:hypothetical protein
MNISRWIARFILAAIAYSPLYPLAIAHPAAPPPSPEMAQALSRPGRRQPRIRHSRGVAHGWAESCCAKFARV